MCACVPVRPARTSLYLSDQNRKARKRRKRCERARASSESLEENWGPKVNTKAGVPTGIPSDAGQSEDQIPFK